jgi:hypothetical protein
MMSLHPMQKKMMSLYPSPGYDSLELGKPYLATCPVLDVDHWKKFFP